MDKIKIEDIANELGIKSRELIDRICKLSPEALLSLNIKSAKSTVSAKVAEDIFHAVMSNNKLSGIKSTITHHTIGQINISLSYSPIDIDFITKVASIYKTKSSEHFMVRSFNFSEMDIVRFFTAGLIGMDVKRHINNKSSKKDLDGLVENLNIILDDVDIENIDDKDPLYGLESYIQKHKPEVVYLEGIDCQKIDKYLDVFQLIRKLGIADEASPRIRFEISFVNLLVENSNESMEKIVSYFKG